MHKKENARKQGLKIIDLEDDQALQEAVLTAYHAMTILLEKFPSSSKIAISNLKKRWIKSIAPPPIIFP